MFRYYHDHGGHIVRKVKYKNLCPLKLDYEYIDTKTDVAENTHRVENGELVEIKTEQDWAREVETASLNFDCGENEEPV